MLLGILNETLILNVFNLALAAMRSVKTGP